MLILKNILKNYKVGDTFIPAIKGIDVVFRDKEFVSILGPSGCGKTTLLNIIGGLDHYTSGDLIISGRSTKEYRDSDWDSYRNAKIGFVFQSYNLISHLSVLDNVSMALALSGCSAKERKERASEALTQVGLQDELHKRPNQLSGGQMQRVAIARALVNKPEILLADEPTGALDTGTSVQIMELIKGLADKMLVVMVTHNPDIANAYSDRIVKMLDGKIVEDSNPCPLESEQQLLQIDQSGDAARGNQENANCAEDESQPIAVSATAQESLDGKSILMKGKQPKKSKRPKRDPSLPKVSMSFVSAIKSSFKNLISKKGRTIATSIAASIGIIGIALVLAVSSGLTGFISNMQAGTLAGMPLTITKDYFDYEGMMSGNISGNKDNLPEFPSDGVIKPNESQSMLVTHTNKITKEYVEYVGALDKGLYNSISYSRAVGKNGVVRTEIGTYIGMNSKSFVEIPNSQEFIQSQYDVIGGAYPTSAGQAVLIVDSKNRLAKDVFDSLGMSVADHEFTEVIGKEFRMAHNDNFYSKDVNGKFTAVQPHEGMYNSAKSTVVKIVGVLRIKQDSSGEMLSTGIGYTTMLTDTLLANAENSVVVRAQQKSTDINVLTGLSFSKTVTYTGVMQLLGGDKQPTGIQIYPKDFDTKDKIKAYLDEYNVGKAKIDTILYNDMAETISKTMTSMINTMTIAMACFAAISLVVSSIMISIITYVSVVERTKEIGIMRSLGARKKDISRIFNAETLLIGLTAGVLGVIIAALLAIPIGILVTNMIGMKFVASVPWLSGIILVLISMALTFVAGLIPSRIASKKDPVVALRTE